MSLDDCLIPLDDHVLKHELLPFLDNHELSSIRKLCPQIKHLSRSAAVWKHRETVLNWASENEFFVIRNNRWHTVTDDELVAKVPTVRLLSHFLGGTSDHYSALWRIVIAHPYLHTLVVRSYCDEILPPPLRENDFRVQNLRRLYLFDYTGPLPPLKQLEVLVVGRYLSEYAVPLSRYLSGYAAPLLQMEHLTELGIGIHSVRQLDEFEQFCIQQCEKLKSLSLVTYPANLPPLRHLKALRSLSISMAPHRFPDDIDDWSMPNLSATAECLTKLKLTYHGSKKLLNPESLNSLVRLKHFTIDAWSCATSVMLQNIPPCVESLRIQSKDVHDLTLPRTCNRLTSLTIDNRSNSRLVMLSLDHPALAQLQRFDISIDDLTSTPGSWDRFGRLAQLRELKLTCTDVEYIEPLWVNEQIRNNVTKKLKRLDLRSSTLLTPDQIKAFESLEQLTIRNLLVDNAFLDSLQPLSHLQLLRIHTDFIPDDCDPVDSTSTIFAHQNKHFEIKVVYNALRDDILEFDL